MHLGEYSPTAPLINIKTIPGVRPRCGNSKALLEILPKLEAAGFIPQVADINGGMWHLSPDGQLVCVLQIGKGYDGYWKTYMQ